MPVIPKTPEPQRRAARNWYRRERGIPEETPLHARTDLNRPRKGAGNRTGRVSMPQAWWDFLDDIRGNLTRGEYIAQAVRTEAIIAGHKPPKLP